MKKAVIIILIIIVCFCIYITMDCIRLKNSEFGTEPLISIKEPEIICENNCVTKYTGMGYTVRYLNNIVTEGEKVVITSGYGAEFWLFDKILVWAWVE